MSNQIRCGIDSGRHRIHVKELKVSELSIALCCVWALWGQDIPIWLKQANNMVAGQNEKSIPALKIYIFLYKAHSISYLNPTQFQELIFPHNSSKNTGSESLYIYTFSLERLHPPPPVLPTLYHIFRPLLPYRSGEKIRPHFKNRTNYLYTSYLAKWFGRNLARNLHRKR